MRALAWTRTQQKTGSAAVPQSPDFRVMRSVAEEQPQQNDHRNRHAKQPKQNSSSHHFLLMHRGENARSRGQFLRRKEALAKERFMILEFPRATIRSETASSRRGRLPRALQCLRRQNGGCASAAIRFHSSGQETARPLWSRADSSDGGRARRNCTRPTSGRCSASRTTAPPAASVRPSATARSNADPASARRPCCRRAAAG